MYRITNGNATTLHIIMLNKIIAALQHWQQLAVKKKKSQQWHVNFNRMETVFAKVIRLLLIIFIYPLI